MTTVALPTFLVIGAHKSGTTTLHSMLAEHPDIYLPEEKEPHFFVPELCPHDRTWYESLFEPGAGHHHRGEASPGYTMFPLFAGAPQRIAELLPDVRLVYLVRDPIERMRSAYLQSAAEGLTVHGSLRRELLWSLHHLSVSQYALQIQRYLPHFDREQLLVVTTEELEAEPAGTLQRVLGHLGLSADWVPSQPSRRLNTSSRLVAMRRRYRPLHRWFMGRSGYDSALGRRLRYSRFATRPFREDELRVDDELRDRLAVMLRSDVAALRDIVGDGFDGWGLLEGGRDG